MLKRRSTLQQSEKSKRNKITEFLLELDRCIQIPNDDKLLIRRKVKENDQEVTALFELHRKDKNYHELQIKLRKVIQVEKNYEKRYTLNYGDRDRKKSETNQRVYSQHSQNASFKNSIKASPEKEEAKKTMITFDICELKKKIEECQNENKASYHLTGSKSKNQIRINSISRINTSNNKSRQSSLDKLPLKEQRPAFSFANSIKSKGVTTNKQISSKITLRISDKHGKQNVSDGARLEQKITRNSTKQQIGIPNHQTSNISYSSSIKNLLMTKLKDKGQNQFNKQKIVLKESSKGEEMLASNRSFAAEINDQTAIKRSAKPMIRDEIHAYPKIFDEHDHIPMYILTENEEDQRKTEKKLEDFGYKNRNVQLRGEKLETLLQSQQSKYGQFYMKIKDIINNKNY